MALQARAGETAGGGLAGFLIAFDRQASYDSPNFLWLRDRLDRLAYVDRIVVDPACRGAGVARALYADPFARALALDHEVVACEVNIEPPNPASDAFHAALGFREIGRRLFGNGKTVRYLARPLAAP